MVKEHYRNAILLVASTIFYAWGAPKFIYTLLALTAIDFFIVKHMYKQADGTKRKLWLAASIFINMGILFYFKYSNFFIENANAVLNKLHVEQVGWTKIVLPIGISFFCFETLTYSVDAYRRIITPLNKLRDYYLYIFFFPKLIAGPIVRFNVMEKQLLGNRPTNYDHILYGFKRFAIGLSKKVLIANTVAAFADSYLGNLDQLNSTVAWLSMLAYTMQIYFDFSGYSDMALGLAMIFGFVIPENFDSPYNSQSITEFWRRWHISLGAWMREYLYIPLGGNRVKSKFRLYFNLWVVFLLSGFWHGASWNFIIWGAFHGTFLILDKLFLLNLLKKVGKWPAVVFTFITVLFGWVFFRMETFAQAKTVIKHMIYKINFQPIDLYENREFVAVLILALTLSFVSVTNKGEAIKQKLYSTQGGNRKTLLIVMVSVVLFCVCLARLTSSNFNPFIYYRF